jgi:hypothetical protein
VCEKRVSMRPVLALTLSTAYTQSHKPIQLRGHSCGFRSNRMEKIDKKGS